MYGAYLPPSYHQTVKKHLLPTKPFAYLCTHNWFSVISPAKCHQDNSALQRGWYKTLTEVLIDCHILSQLWNTERKERGWICTRLLYLKRCFCAKHFQSALPWKYHFVFFFSFFFSFFFFFLFFFFFFFFFRLVATRGLSEIEVTTDFKRQNFEM